MSGGDSLLEHEEVEFLLQQADTSAPDNGPDPGQEQSAQITIRGDLKNINLADIFQTLSMSKMRGILKVFNPLESRLIYFDQEGMRILYPARDETRRVGQRLVRTRVVSVADMREALAAQKDEYRPLGEILVDHGHISTEELEAILCGQLEEDLHNVFTWRSGHFEFFKNKPDDAETLDRLEHITPFEINGFLLEAARRSDEWSQILEVVGTVHGVPVIPPETDFPELAGAKLTVAEAIDDHSTISQLAESTLLGLFNCSRAICDLSRDGFVKMADPEELLELARESAEKDDHRRTLLLCQSIQAANQTLDFSFCRKLAVVLKTTREPKMGAVILFECVSSLGPGTARIEIAKLAHELDRSSIAIMQFLREEFATANLTDDDDYPSIIDRLCDTLSETGANDEALTVFAEIERATPGDNSMLSRKARLLHKAGQTDAALEILFSLREVYEAEGDKDRLVKLYEQMLKLRGGQRDIIKALRQLKLGKSHASLIKVYYSVAIVAVLVGGWLTWSWISTSEQIAKATKDIRACLDNRDIAGARSALVEAETYLGANEKWADLRRAIAGSEERMRLAAKLRRDRANQKNVNKIAAALERSDLVGALILYKGMLAKPRSAKAVSKTAPGRFRLVLDRLDALHKELTLGIPGPTTALVGMPDLRTNEKILAKKSAVDTTLATRLLEVQNDDTLVSLWDEGERNRAMRLAKEMLAAAKLVDERAVDYANRIEKLEKNRRLNPVYRAAHDAEREHDFETAEMLYKQLYEEFRGSKDLAPTFRDAVTKYAAINRHRALLKTAIAKGKFLEARAYYRYLKLSYKEYPWDRMVKLPLRVVTTPPGAEIWFNGGRVGQSPLTIQFQPGVENRVELRLDGFRSEQAVVSGDGVGIVRAIFSRLASWTIVTPGAVDKPPLITDNDKVIVVDRSGTISSWSMADRQRVWSHRTGDLSGLLTRPIPWKDHVIVASLDGTLRVLDRGTGDITWKLTDLRCESTPVIRRSTLAIAAKQRLSLISLDTRERWHSIDFDSPVTQDLLLVGSIVVAVEKNGTVHMIDIKTGRERWKPLRLDPGVVCQPMVHGSTAVFATDEGYLSAYDMQNGRQRWRRDQLGELRWTPTSDGKWVYVGVPSSGKVPATLLSFDLHTGVPGPRFTAPADEIWSTPPVALRDKVLIGSRSGLFWVMDATTLKLRYWIRGQGAAAAQPANVPEFTLVCPFAGKQVLVVSDLR